MYQGLNKLWRRPLLWRFWSIDFFVAYGHLDEPKIFVLILKFGPILLTDREFGASVYTENTKRFYVLVGGQLLIASHLTFLHGVIFTRIS